MSHFSAILPVLLLEYLAISIARTILPQLLVRKFGSFSYVVIGCAEAIKGLLAFWACPTIGKLSDSVGRKPFLLMSIVGTTLPICILAVNSNMILYLIFFAISGIFAGTFTLTFAYISDCVEKRKRAPAYGLALATFGFSFTIGPIIGSYIASLFGNRIVFVLSSILVVLNIVYMLYYLPETVITRDRDGSDTFLFEKLPGLSTVFETIAIFRKDKFLFQVGVIIFLYYTSVWAMISTLMVYATKYLMLSAQSLGWLLSGYGVSTMISESVLVRVIVPQIGEVNSIRLGLICFSIQCFVIAFSSSVDGIILSILFSMGSNLVYPSISSIVSKTVGEDKQGEALGALNGIKALVCDTYRTFPSFYSYLSFDLL